MKSRLLAVLLSISLLFGSMPAIAAEPNNRVNDTVSVDKINEENNFIENKTADKSEISDEEESESDSLESANDDNTEKNDKGSTVPSGTENDGKDGEASKETDESDKDGEDSSKSDADNKDNTESSDTKPDTGDNTEPSGTESDNEDNKEPSDTDLDSEDNTEPSDTASDSEDNTEPSDTESGTEDNTTPSEIELDSKDNAEDIQTVETQDEEEALYTALEYGQNTITIVKNTADNKTGWFSFTAPETGYYNFSTNNDTYTYMYLCDNLYGDPVGEKTRFDFLTYYIKKDVTVYLNIYLSPYSSVNSLETELEVRRLISDVPIKSEANQTVKTSYFDMGDRNLVVSHEIGAYNVRLNISIEAKDGNTLADEYNVYAHLVNKADNSISFTRMEKLYQYKYYQSEFSLSAKPGREYELHVLAEDADGNLTAIYIIDSEIFIEKVSEKVVIHAVEATINSITLDIDAKEDVYCYYAPTDFSVEEDGRSPSERWKKVTFDGLLPNTEYYFQFTDSDKKPIYEMKASTGTSEAETSYSAQISENKQDLELKADVKGYKGSGFRAYFYCEYLNAFGETVSRMQYLDLSNIDPDDSLVKNFTFEDSISLSKEAFEADKTYDITMWIEILSKDSSGEITEVLPKEVKAIKTPEATFDPDDLDVSVETLGTSGKTSAECTVKINNLTADVSGCLFYRQVGSKALYKAANETITLSQSAPSGKLYASYLSVGDEYEFVVIIGGIMKSVTARNGSQGVKLTKIGDDEINPFDFVCTYKLESDDGKPLSGSYKLQLFYLNKIKGYYEALIFDAAEFNKENGYQASIRTATLKTTNGIRPDTDYDLQWRVSDASDDTNELLCSYFETIHTKRANFTFTELESNYYLQRYQVTLNMDDIANFEDFPAFTLHAYVKKAGTHSYRYFVIDKEFNKNNGYSVDFPISVLEANTAYELSLREVDGRGLVKDKYEYATASFTTPEDLRKVEMTNVISEINSVKLSYMFTGFTPSMSGYVHCYIREKGSDGKWEKSFHTSYRGTTSTVMSLYSKISSYDNKELKDGTEYEYIIGLGYSETEFDELEIMLEGTFSTIEDARTLSDARASAAYTIADISAVLSGNEPFDKSYIYLFYKEKDADAWTKADRVRTGDAVYQYSTKLTGLTTDTEYEYMLVVSDSVNCNDPDEVTRESRKTGGAFTTSKCNYTLDFAVDETKLTSNSAAIAVTAKGSTDDDSIQVVLSLNNGQEKSLNLKRSQDYKAEAEFTNLTHETEYMINKAVIKVMEADSYVTIADIACDYKFTTKAIEVPREITLSKDKLTLNAIYDSINDGIYDGYNSEILKAEVSPETAEKDFVYISSHPEIATVSDNGRVIARGIGTAEITVESKYDSDIKAVCEVTVKKYAVGIKYGNEEPKILTDFNDVYYVYKTDCVEDLGLYECDNEGNVTLLSDYTVTSSKTGIAEWREGKLYANSPGVTAMKFEKDGIKANLMVNVTTEGKGFGITGFTTDSDYPAIKEEDGSYTLAYENGISYTTVIEISPSHEFSPLDFSWNISEQDEEIASVSNMGVITPKKAGSIQLTVKPVKHYTINEKPYINNEVVVTLNIKPLPAQNGEYIHALANISKTIGDVEFPKSWGEGWRWKFPDTPLVTNGVYSLNSYPFEAVYSGTENYPSEKTLMVYMARITGVSVNEITDDDVPKHNQIVEVGTGDAVTDDAVTLSILPVYQGKISSLGDFTAEIPDVKGLTITRVDGRTFTIRAQKKGNYTLKPVFKAYGSDKVLASTKYKIKAVEEKQIGSITLTTDTDGVEIKDNTVILNKADTETNKEITIKAEVKDRYGADISTALVWKSSNKKTAVVKAASKSDTHTANVTLKGDGHTVISVTAKDSRKLSVSLNLEIQDHRPRIDTAKASVNIAYDYDNDIYVAGKTYAAAAGGAVEIVPVYGDTLKTVELRDQDGENAATGLKISSYDAKYKYLVSPSFDDLETGTYNCSIYVKTSEDKEYSYPLKVSVIDKAPSVSAKMGDVPDLFFKNSRGTIDIKISGEGKVRGVTWEDASADIGNGFSVRFYNHDSKKKLSWLLVEQQSNLKLENGRLSEPDVANGTLTVKLDGYKKLYTFENFTIKYNYRKPVLVTKSHGNLIPSIGQNSSLCSIYDKTNKTYLYYTNEDAEYANFFYDEIKCDSPDVTIMLEDGNSGPKYSYGGTENNKKITLTIDAPLWRESLSVVHTIKSIKPVAYLSDKTLSYNTNFQSVAYSYVNLKNAQNITYTDIVVTGANAKSKKLLDDDLFIITTSDNQIKVEQSRADLMGTSVAAGTYSYKVTPYCNKPGTDENIPLNTLTLKIKVINKAVKVKVTPKGRMDLTYGAESMPHDKKNVVILADPKFSNMGSEYSVNDFKLIGEYSNYFTLHEKEIIKYGSKYQEHYYISINNDEPTCKLKANQPYRLAIEYTISNNNGDKFIVTSNTFTIKPKQTTPKIKVLNNNQTLYAGAFSFKRTYSLSVPSYYYIEEALGGIDCNKDGKTDISVRGSSDAGSYAIKYLDVRITDRDAVSATAKGKSYSIPVTLKLKGRDGIAKDVKVKIKVNLKK